MEKISGSTISHAYALIRTTNHHLQEKGGKEEEKDHTIRNLAMDPKVTRVTLVVRTVTATAAGTAEEAGVVVTGRGGAGRMMLTRTRMVDPVNGQEENTTFTTPINPRTPRHRRQQKHSRQDKLQPVQIRFRWQQDSILTV